VRRRRRARPRRRLHRLRALARPVAWATVIVVALLLAAGIVFAGSSSRIASGVSVEGVKLSGLTRRQARDLLSSLAAKYADVPVVFKAGHRRWSFRPKSFDVRVDWGSVVERARAAGDAPPPLRGLKRLKLRVFGSDVEPSVDVYDDALDYELSQIADAVAVPPREAAITLHGLAPRVVPARAGRALDRRAARRVAIPALGSFEREPVALPVRIDRPRVTAAALAPVAADVRTALSRPVRLRLGQTQWLLRPRRLASLLVLPANGRRELAIGGPAARRYFARLARRVNRVPRNARFVVSNDGSVSVVPALEGRKLDMAATRAALLAAATSKRERQADLVVATSRPDLTTERAKSFSITRLLSYYSTAYAGTYDRIHNLQLAVSLINGTLVAPGEVFSLNHVVGERTSERGFRVAPVIVGGEYEEAVGGGVSQVATTVFNAAWEAGLKILERNPHALYIARYPAGRDATVNYPNLDLKFLNDTDGYLLVRGGYDNTGISISILGPNTGRRVVSETGPLEDVEPPPVERVKDPDLFVGRSFVEDDGEPARAVTVTRKVYAGEKILYDETWSTRYRAEPRIVHVGTKPRPKPQRPTTTAPAETGPAGTAPGETAPAETAPTETAPAETAPTATAPAETAPAETAPAVTGPPAAGESPDTILPPPSPNDAALR
jgi:vancomycin resistance protein YoaR